MVKRLHLFLGIVCALIALWLIAPTLVIIPMSFNEKKSLAFPPSGFSLQWYQNFWNGSEWWKSFLSSLKIAALVSVISTVVGTLAAIGLQKIKGKLAGAIRALLLAPIVIPGVVLAVGLYALYLELRLVGTVTGFVVAHTMLAIPFVVVAVGASLEVFDNRLVTAAASLGANRWKAFLTVMLPLIAPGVMSGALFAFVTSFDEIVVALFINSPYLKPLPVQIYTSITRDSDPTVAAVGSLMFFATTGIIAAGLYVASNRRSRTHAR